MNLKFRTSTSTFDYRLSQYRTQTFLLSVNQTCQEGPESFPHQFQRGPCQPPVSYNVIPKWAAALVNIHIRRPSPVQGRNLSLEHAAKQRQALFRETSPTIGAQTRAPTDDKGLRNLHLLAVGCEEENLYPSIQGLGGAVEFFHKRGIRWWKSARSGDDTSVDGPTRNMASP